jgi:hypothetical protein
VDQGYERAVMAAGSDAFIGRARWIAMRRALEPQCCDAASSSNRPGVSSRPVEAFVVS